jgi:hypothetical protein
VDASVIHDVGGNNLLQELAAALEEGDGMICFGQAIVRLVEFWNWYHFGRMPGVCSVLNASIEQVNKVKGRGRESPLQQLVVHFA